MLRIYAQTVTAGLFDQVAFGYVANEGMVAGCLGAYHLCALVLSGFHYAAIATV